MPISSLAAYWRLQAVDNSVGVHPTGYSAGQFQSVTAGQWQNMYNAEVTAYNTEVAAYMDMVSQRDTWIARAYSDWGASRVWNSGESWEAAYNRVYTDRYNQGYADGQRSLSPATWEATINTVPTNISGGWFQSATVILPYSGYYVAFATGRGGEFSPNWQLETEMHVEPNVYWANYGYNAKPAHPQGGESYVKVSMPRTFYGAGTAAYFRVRYSDNNGDPENTMYICFVPSVSNPH